MAESISLTVTGMKCGGCESNVKTKLSAVDGIISVNASHKENKVTVEFSQDSTDIAHISKVITDAGFTVE